MTTTNRSARRRRRRRRRPTASPTVTPAADDKTAAEFAALKIEDFPTGWTANESAENLESRCEEVEAAQKLTSARANSPRFSQGQTTLAQNAIYVFEDEATAEQAFGDVSGQETQDCYSKAVTDVFAGQAGIESGTPQIAPLEITPVGDEHAAARVTVPIEAQGLELNVSIDLVFVRGRPRAVAEPVRERARPVRRDAARRAHRRERRAARGGARLALRPSETPRPARRGSAPSRAARTR